MSQAAIFAAMMATGSGLKAIGQISEGKMAQAQGKAREDIALYNQRQLDRTADARLEAARFDDFRVARQARIALGESVAKAGASGLAVNQVSLADQAYQFAIDRNLTLRRGLLQSRELRQQGRISAAEGAYAKRIGRAQKRAAYLKAGGSILSGGFQAFQALPTGGGSGINSATGSTGASQNVMPAASSYSSWSSQFMNRY